MSDKLGLRLGRTLTAVVLIGGAVYAPYFSDADTLYDSIQSLLSLFQGPTLAILLLGIFWSRATAAGGFAGLGIGVLMTVLLNILGDGSFANEQGVDTTIFLSSDASYLYISFWSFIASLIVTIAVSLVTKPKSPEELHGLVYVYSGNGSKAMEQPSS